MSATIEEIVDDALSVVGEHSGPGVATYSEDIMFADAIRAFNLLFNKTYWEQYRQWFQLTLDGTLGIITTDALDHVRSYEDIYAVHRDKEVNPLPILPKAINPFTITGTALRYWTSLPATDANFVNRKIQFWPKTATGIVNVCARVYPRANGENWNTDDVMHLDKDMLVAGVAFMTLSRDDTNSGAAEMQRQMMEMRYKDIKASLADRPMLVSGGQSPIPDQWLMQT